MIRPLLCRAIALCAGLGSLPSLAADYTLNQETTHVAPVTRGAATSTHFGWDSFGAISTPIDDTTPDIGANPPAGVRFRTTNTEDHTSGSGNYYSYSSPPAEEVTVVTNGTPGVDGKTTIIVQLVTLFGGFPSDFIISPINGVQPTVVQGTNKASRGQLWARWEIPGNQASYTFTITGAPDTSAYSFDKIEVDTFFAADGATIADTMILSEPAAANLVLEQLPGITAPSSRSGRGTTYFGWDTFGVSGPATVINDNTPDIGTDSTGTARFRTANDQVHQFSGGGNLYLLSFNPNVNLTLDEEITVPTKGVVGTEGYTTIILQIASASSGMGGASFANEIFIRPINGIEPTIVVQGAGATTAQLWAKWEIPGNQATYTIDIDGVENQQHYSFDKVVVDTKYSRYGYVGDTVREKTVEITTETLASATKGVAYSLQLAATGGTTPHVWSLATGSTLPDGLTLSAAGVLSGTPTTLGVGSFTVVAKDGQNYEAQATYTLDVVPGLKIPAPNLMTAVVGNDYSATLVAEGGPAPYEWEVAGGALPAGLSLDAEDGTISGRPTAAGTFSVTVKVTDGDTSSVTRTFDMVVSPTLIAPVIDPIVFAPTTPGAKFNHTVTARNYPKQFVITGLPKGLKYVASTGVITGNTSVAGVYVVQVRASNSGGTSPAVTAPLIVRALAPSQIGTFTGIVKRNDASNTGLGSLVSLTTTGTGTFTVQVKTGSASKSAKGLLEGSAPQVKVDVGGVQLRLTLGTNGLIAGTHGEATVSGWRQVWDAKLNPASRREGYYSIGLLLEDDEDEDVATIPQGSGYATFSVVPAGTLKLVGKTADGQALTAATFLGPNGEIAVYVPLYANKGTLVGDNVVLAEDEEGLFVGNSITGLVTWQKPVTTGRTYPAAFGPVDLAVTGGYLAPAAKGQIVLGLPDVGSFNLEFEKGGVDLSATEANVANLKWTEDDTVSFTGATNGSGATLKVDKATGAVSGTFSLKETAPPLERKNIKFQGQVVKTADGEIKAVGNFLLPQIPTGSERTTTSPILSGSVFITQGGQED